MIDNSSKWSMEFTNDEIKRYLADKTKEWAEVCYLVDDIYVEQDSKDNFDYITFDGTKQNFYISFYGTQTAIFFNNNEIMFIDDDEKKHYTSSDVFDNVVYEGRLNDKSHKQILGLILKFVNLLHGVTDIEIKQEVLIPDSLESYGKSNYIININNPLVDSGKYIFENIEINLPHNIHAYLENAYGDYMRIPPVEEREKHWTVGFCMDLAAQEAQVKANKL